MRFNRYPKIAIRSVTAVVALLAGIAVLLFVEQRRTQAEFGAVLSAYLSDEVLHDPHDWGSGRGIQIILGAAAFARGGLSTIHSRPLPRHSDQRAHVDTRAEMKRKVVRPERFELPTFWFVARRSIQLS